MTFKELGSIPRLSRPGNLNSKFHKFPGSVQILHVVLIIKWQNLRSLPLPFWTCHSPFKLGQPLHHVNICRMKFGQTAIQHCQQIRFDNAKHRLGLGHGSTGPTSLLDAIFFYRCHNGPAVQYGNDSAETTVVWNQVVGFWGWSLSGRWPP